MGEPLFAAVRHFTTARGVGDFLRAENCRWTADTPTLALPRMGEGNALSNSGLTKYTDRYKFEI